MDAEADWNYDNTYASTRGKNNRRIWNTLHFLTRRCIYAKFYKFFWPTIKTQNAFYLPVGDGKVSLVDVRDIASVATKILLTKNNGTKTINNMRTKNMHYW